MTESLTLSRYRLETFLACQRRFDLRFLRRMPWPVAPLDERAETARQRGEAFHQLMERHFLNFPAAPETTVDSQVRRWRSLFLNSRLEIPEGKAYPEHSLTIPVGRHFLNGRFDLLILHNNAAHIFDWKTGQPRREADLRQDWQTRLYLAMLAESGQAFGQKLDPDQINITYWYVNDLDAPRLIQYNQAWHSQNWAAIQAIVAQIDTAVSQNAWPLTEDWTQCRRCAYQTYCDRQEAGAAMADESEETEDAKTDLFFEPELP